MPRLVSLGGWLAHPLVRLRRAKRPPQDLEIRPLEGPFGRSFDALWRAVEQNRTIAVARDASYLNWLEHARWELFRDFGLAEKLDGAITMVRQMELDYKAETFYGDRLRVATWPRVVGNTSMVLGASIRVGDAFDSSRIGKVVLSSSTVLVCIKEGAGKIRVPDGVRALFPEEDPGDLSESP